MSGRIVAVRLPGVDAEVRVVHVLRRVVADSVEELVERADTQRLEFGRAH